MNVKFSDHKLTYHCCSCYVRDQIYRKLFVNYTKFDLVRLLNLSLEITRMTCSVIAREAIFLLGPNSFECLINTVVVIVRKNTVVISHVKLKLSYRVVARNRLIFMAVFNIRISSGRFRRRSDLRLSSVAGRT